MSGPKLEEKYKKSYTNNHRVVWQKLNSSQLMNLVDNWNWLQHDRFLSNVEWAPLHHLIHFKLYPESVLFVQLTQTYYTNSKLTIQVNVKIHALIVYTSGIVPHGIL